jgi:para-aminobenzoate synthetase/4-amino-4-deoxychorismate lyase
VTPTVIVRDGRTLEWLHFADPVEIVEAHRVGDVVPALRAIETRVAADGLHAAGFLSYEAAPAFDRALAVRTGDDFPLLWFGLYRATRRLARPTRGSADASTRGVGAVTWTPTVSREAYDQAVDRVAAHLADGDTYQVNYSFRLRAAWRDDPWGLFERLVDAQDPTYGAWLDTGRFAIASASPELFFAREGRQVTCQPMKGTARRGRFPAEDRAMGEALRTSEKNRAENVMIVDMIRNDLGRVAEIGSVEATRLFAVDRYRTLWQMTSTVTAGTEASVTEIMTALFPCASITGAPKVRTCEIIAALETTPRRIYTGSIGLIEPNGRAQFNVAIRTALIDHRSGAAEYGVGGGIVWDSRPADEYAECLLKARVLTARRDDFSLLETMRWTPGDGYALLDGHLARLRDSADYFDVTADIGAVRDRLVELAATFDATPRVVRLLLAPDGAVTLTDSPVVESPTPVRLSLARGPVDSNDVFLFHKTTRRGVYESARAARPDADDVLLWNERGEITETTIANVVVEMDGLWWTPPITCGLLAGTYRAALLDEGRIRERVIPVARLRQATKVAVINSVRGWRAAVMETA